MHALLYAGVGEALQLLHWSASSALSTVVICSGEISMLFMPTSFLEIKPIFSSYVPDVVMGSQDLFDVFASRDIRLTSEHLDRFMQELG